MYKECVQCHKPYTSDKHFKTSAEKCNSCCKKKKNVSLDKKFNKTYADAVRNLEADSILPNQKEEGASDTTSIHQDKTGGIKLPTVQVVEHEQDQEKEQEQEEQEQEQEEQEQEQDQEQEEQEDQEDQEEDQEEQEQEEEEEEEEEEDEEQISDSEEDEEDEKQTAKKRKNNSSKFCEVFPSPKKKQKTTNSNMGKKKTTKLTMKEKTLIDELEQRDVPKVKQQKKKKIIKEGKNLQKNTETLEQVMVKGKGKKTRGPKPGASKKKKMPEKEKSRRNFLNAIITLKKNDPEFVFNGNFSL